MKKVFGFKSLLIYYILVLSIVFLEAAALNSPENPPP
jgi:hypothetical protein